MSKTIQSIFIMVKKDLLLEFRGKDILVSVPIFGFLLIVLFNFALDVSPNIANHVAPGILWVSFAFAGILTMNRAFVRESEQGGLEGLLLSPISRDAIFISKVLSSCLFMFVVEIALLFALTIMMNIRMFSIVLVVTVLLTTLGFTTLGTLFSAIAVQTRSREVMLPVLFFPMVIPLLIAAVEITSEVISGQFIGIGKWLPFIIIFDALFLLICPWLFGTVMQE